MILYFCTVKSFYIMKRSFSLFCLFCFVWLQMSCSNESFEDVFEISYKSLSFEKVSTPLDSIDMAVLVFSFIDGNGNIGDRYNDKTSIVCYTWYKKLPDQTYEPYTFPSGDVEQFNPIPYSSVMDKDQAQNKTIKGTIQALLFRPTNTQGLDTMRIGYYIVDRLKKESNIDFTPDFSILDPQDIEKP